jgi:thioredoxin reductase
MRLRKACPCWRWKPALRRPGSASARIENFLGFPTGITGRALAGRAYVQAQKFGVEMAIPAPAGRLLCDTYPLQVEMCGSLQRLQARTVVLSCGARYRRPSLANLRQFEGKGVYYWASPVEAKLCKTKRSSWSAAAIRPVRRPCSCRARPSMCTC